MFSNENETYCQRRSPYGHDPGTRALTGGAIGVGAAAVLGAPLVAGAAVGAVAGAATTPDHHDDRRDRRRDRRDDDRY